MHFCAWVMPSHPSSPPSKHLFPLPIHHALVAVNKNDQLFRNSQSLTTVSLQPQRTRAVRTTKSSCSCWYNSSRKCFVDCGNQVKCPKRELTFRRRITYRKWIRWAVRFYGTVIKAFLCKKKKNQVTRLFHYEILILNVLKLMHNIRLEKFKLNWREEVLNWFRYRIVFFNFTMNSLNSAYCNDFVSRINAMVVT